MWLKWTQRCQQKVGENWQLETDFTWLVKKVHLPQWLLANGYKGLHFFCTWKMMVPGMFWSCQQLDHLLHGRAVKSKAQISDGDHTTSLDSEHVHLLIKNMDWFLEMCLNVYMSWICFIQALQRRNIWLKKLKYLYTSHQFFGCFYRTQENQWGLTAKDCTEQHY